MQYFSTRGGGPATLDQALRQGLAEDGGLFLPEALPRWSPGDFDAADSITDVAGVLLAPFFAGSMLADDLDAIIAETFTSKFRSLRCPATTVLSYSSSITGRLRHSRMSEQPSGLPA